MGTVFYMSPEQARGNETDARTDLWSLGVVLYEMIARQIPFRGQTSNHTIVAILEQEPSALGNAPPELQRIVRKALTKDVEMRYQSARDLLIDLKNLRRDLDIQGELDRSLVPSFAPNPGAATSPLNEQETRVNPGASSGATGTRSNERATLDRSARPCARLARLATGFDRNTSESRSSSATRAGSRWAEVTSGNAFRPHCTSDCLANACTPAPSNTCPCCTLASSPAECANPPDGKAESINCHIRKFMSENSQQKIRRLASC
jgi:serine/threonine protein kinase